MKESVAVVKEADRIEDTVIKMPEPQAVSRENLHIQRVCQVCEKEELRQQPIVITDNETMNCFY